MKKTDFPQRLIVTGTDTDIGKTLVSAVLTTGLSAVYWKPVQSGAEGQTDREWVREKTGLGDNHFPPEAYLLRAPVSPHLAAAMEGIAIDLARVIPPALPPGVSHMVIEGAGGVLAPLNDRHFMIDLFKQLNTPALVVAPSRVGMINHTLLTVDQLRQHGIPVFGVIMNGPRNDENRKAVEHFGRVPVIGEIEPMASVTPEGLMRTFHSCFG